MKVSNRIIVVAVLIVMTFLTTSCGIQNSSSENLVDKEKNENLILNKVTDAQYLSLKGKVKKVRQDEYDPGSKEGEIGFRTGENSFVFSFDEKGEKTEDIILDAEGLQKKYANYLYSSTGKKVQKDFFNSEAKLLSTSKFEFDSHDRISKTNIKDYEGAIDYYINYTYDDNGNEIGVSYHSLEGDVISSTESYFTNGLKVKTILKDEFGISSAIVEYSYNEHGDVVKELYYTGNNLLFEEYTNEYLYDQKTNWVKKISRLTAKHMNSSSNADKEVGVSTITLRTFTYY